MLIISFFNATQNLLISVLRVMGEVSVQSPADLHDFSVGLIINFCDFPVISREWFVQRIANI